MTATRSRLGRRRRAGAAFWLAWTTGLVLATGWALTTHVGWPAPSTLTTVWDEHLITWREPRAFWLLALLPLVPLLQWFTLSDFSTAQRTANALARMSVLAMLVAAAAQPTTSRFDATLCTTYVVDVSASVPDEVLVEARARIETQWEQRGTHQVRLVTFAERPQAITLAPGQRQVPEFVRPEGDEVLGSHPAAAMRLAYGLCPTNTIARIVLVTDGNENRGSMLSEAGTAEEFGIPVSVMEIDVEPAPELMVRDLELPDEIRLSEPFTMVAEIISNRETTARFSLQQNEFRDITAREVELSPGLNRVEFVAEVYEPGFRRFEFTLRADGEDRFDDNNRFVRTVTVEGRPQVLYVEGVGRSRTYLQRAVARERNDLANFDLEVRTAFGFPTSLDEMANYDMIIMSDVSARYVSRVAMANLERYVRQLGGTLLMVGGERSFGPGGFDNTLIEEISPVTFDMQRQRNQPSLAMLLVIDRSGSMDGLKLEMAKDAAQAVVELLGPQDAIGVIAFDTVPQTVVRLQSATNRARIRADIGRIAAGGGTDILPALTDAYIELTSRAARIKHVIVLTDGAAPWDGLADLTSTMRADGITVSSVAVGADADRSLLEMISDLGGGRFHATNDPNNIPQIFVQETSEVARTNLVEEPFRPVVTGRSQALRGIDWSAVPYLLGYVQTRAKARAQVLLETEQGDPLLARWRLGVGRVAVFTSDLKNRWAVEWVRSRVYPQFWAQLIRDLMRVDTEEELAMQARVEAGRGRILVDAIDGSDRFISGLQSVVTITGPEGDRWTVPLEQTAAGRYEADVPLRGYGSYQLEAEHELDGRSYAVSFGALTWPYPDEYTSFEPDRAAGRRVAELTGGRVNPEPAWLWDTSGEEREVRESLWHLPLFAALFLFIVDVLVRRVRWFGRRALAWRDVLARSAT